MKVNQEHEYEHESSQHLYRSLSFDQEREPIKVFHHIYAISKNMKVLYSTSDLSPFVDL